MFKKRFLFILIIIPLCSSEETVFESCHDALRAPNSTGTGIYEIMVSDRPVTVMCDDDLYGGLWLVIQRRIIGDVNFKRGYQAYKLGFGTFQGDFWLGLDLIYEIANTHECELILAMENWRGKKYYAKYSDFKLDNEKNNFKISNLGKFSGNVVRDSFRTHQNKPFSTDNECAKRYKAGWWWSNCYGANLNGLYPVGYFKTAISAKKVMNWVTYNLHEPLKFVQMMIRPKERTYDAPEVDYD